MAFLPPKVWPVGSGNNYGDFLGKEWGGIGSTNGVLNLTIDSSKIDNNLINFPLTIHLNVSAGIALTDVTDIFSELTSNSQKIAVFSGDSQCYVEIEEWDYINQKATLHVKVPYIPSDTDSTLKLYYDSNNPDNNKYVGSVNTTAGELVWDNNFIAVYHLAEDPTGIILDSTSNNVNGSSVGSMASNDLIDTPIGKGLNFNGNNQCIDLGLTNVIGNISGEITVETVNSSQSGGDSTPCIVGRYDSDVATLKGWLLLHNAVDGKISFDGRDHLGGSYRTSGDLSSASWNAGWQYITGRREIILTNSLWKIWKDEGTDTKSSALIANTGSIVANEECGIAAQHGVGNIWDNFFKGDITEVRISNINRSDDWLKATYYSLFDNLITYTSGGNGNYGDFLLKDWT